MANSNVLRSKKARSAIPKDKSMAAKKTSTSSDTSAKSVVDDPRARIGSAVDALFENDNVAREAFAKHLKKRSTE
jgi:hypothetical protein